MRHPMRSAIEAFKLANGFFVIPLMMAFGSLLLGASGWSAVLLTGALTLALIIVIAMAVEHYLFTQIPTLWRIVCVVSGLLIVWPSAITRTLGVLLAVVAIATNFRAHRLQN